MNRKIIVSLVALLMVGAGAFYAVHSGYMQFVTPTQKQLDTTSSQSDAATTQKTAETGVTTDVPQEEQEDGAPSVSANATSSSQAESSSTPPAPSSESTPPLATQVSTPASSSPPVIPEKKENAGTVFEGYTVTVTDSKTPAKMALGKDWPITTLYFMAENGDHLGSISGTAYKQIMDKYKVMGSDSGVWNAPGAGGEWEFWFAEKFNDFRGLSGGSSGGLTRPGNSQGGASGSNVDIDSYADEVIRLINQKREAKGLNTLEVDSELMSHAEVRAKELATQYSHVRPNGTKETSECIVMRRDSPSAAVKAWMESDPHRDAILNESGRFPYQYMGSGCYQDEKGVLYWVVTFGTDYGDGNSGDKNSAEGTTESAKTSYSLNTSELSLTAGEEYQLSVEASSPVENMQVEWAASKLSDGILSVDSDGYITTYYRSGMTSAKATVSVSAKIYVSDKLVKTLNCKVVVTQ